MPTLEDSLKKSQVASSAGPVSSDTQITPAGSDRYGIVKVAMFGTATPATISDVTWGGTSIVANVIKNATHDGLSRKRLAWFYYLDPPASAATIAVTLSEASIDWGFIAEAWSGVDQATPYSNLTNTADGAGQSADPGSIAVTSSSDGVVTDSYYAWSGGSGQTATPTQTSIQEIEAAGTNGFVLGASRAAGTGGSVTMEWDASGTPTWCSYGINLNAAAAAGGTTHLRHTRMMMGMGR